MRISIDSSYKWEMPLYSFVPAGYPMTSVDVNKQEIDINRFLVPHPTATFLLKVKGDSMILKWIVDGDFVIVDRGATNMLDHDIVAATVDGWSEFIIHTLRMDDTGNKYLEPSNLDYSNIYPKESLEILGKVVWVFRRVH